MAGPASQAARYAHLIMELRQQRRAREREPYDGHDRNSYTVSMRDLARRHRRRLWNRRMAITAETWSA